MAYCLCLLSINGRETMTIETKFDEDDFAYHKIRSKWGYFKIVDLKKCEIIAIHIEYVAGEEHISYQCLYCDEDDYKNQIEIDEHDLADEEEYQQWLLHGFIPIKINGKSKED